MNKRSELCAMILAVAELYEKAPTDAALELYWQVLKEESLDDISARIRQHLADPERCRFMPKPGELIYHKSAATAWSEVEDAMRVHGLYRSVCFEDTVINAVIRDMGGWPWICSQDLGQPWTRKEFERLYDIYRRDGIRWEQRLVGEHEADNCSRGYLEWVEPPRLVAEIRPGRLIAVRSRKQLPTGVEGNNNGLS